MFTKEIIQSIANADHSQPTGDWVLDRLFVKYNEASPRDDSPVYYRFLYRLAQHFKDQRLTMLELGCKYGAASLHFLKGGGHQSLAVDCTNLIEPEMFLREVPAAAFSFHQSLSTAPELLPLAAALNPDIIFIDTDHAYETTKAEFEMWEPTLRKGGIMLFDDVCAPEYGCTKFFNEIQGDKLLLPHLHPMNWGFGVYFK